MGVVCEGYAKAFKVLCDQLGVPAVCVSGLSDKSRTGSGHMWNLAQIGGSWYLVDVTWDDSDTAGAQASSRRYLLVSNYTNNMLLTSRQASGNFRRLPTRGQRLTSRRHCGRQRPARRREASRRRAAGAERQRQRSCQRWGMTSGRHPGRPRPARRREASRRRVAAADRQRQRSCQRWGTTSGRRPGRQRPARRREASR